MKENTQYILIDDDELIHLAWKMAAKSKNVPIQCFYTVEDFLNKADQLSKDITICIDSDLGNKVKGEIESEKIFNLGFEKIYLATGISASEFDKPHWIIEIIGKEVIFAK